MDILLLQLIQKRKTWILFFLLGFVVQTHQEISQHEKKHFESQSREPITTDWNRIISQDLMERRKREVCIEIEDTTDDVIMEFGNTFTNLSSGIDEFSRTTDLSESPTILFVGKTGAGKSTLVQFLTNSTNLSALWVGSEESGDFLIEDTDHKISTDTTVSKTLYPDLMKDKDTGVVFIDCPGFRDTRSGSHEIIATYGMLKAVKVSKKIKIAIIVNHASLQSGMYRDDFTDLLQYFVAFLKRIDKFQESIYIIATKVENVYYKEKRTGNLMLVSDDTKIKNIASFLTEVKQAFNHGNKYGRAFVEAANKLIDGLLSKDEEGRYRKINIFRKPDQAGSLSTIGNMQMSRTSLRNTLLNDDNYVQADVKDFNHSVSENGKLYIKNLYRHINLFMSNVTATVSRALVEHYNSTLTSYNDITLLIEDLSRANSGIRDLAEKMGKCNDPGEYSALLKNYRTLRGIPVCDNIILEISILNGHFENLKYFVANNAYMSSMWNNSMIFADRYIETELNFYRMLRMLYDQLASYNIQRENYNNNIMDSILIEAFYGKNGYHLSKTQGRHVSDKDMKILLEKVGLKQYLNLVLDERKLKTIEDDVIDVTLRTKTEKICENNTLIIIGGFVSTSEIDRNTARMCYDSNAIVILASHTLYIDSDLTTDLISGRNVMILAPVWSIRGKHAINVDGKPPEKKPEKAYHSEIGLDGRDGFNAGSFLGIGLRFENSADLTVTSSGGDGQDGQDGGNGKHGESGVDGVPNDVITVDSHSKIYLIYNQGARAVLARGKLGTDGGNAGAGGYGGKPGQPGTVEFYNLNRNIKIKPKIVSEIGRPGKNGEDGIPGRGGYNGCDYKAKDKDHYLLFIPVGTSSDRGIVACDRMNPNGNVTQSPRKINSLPPNVPSPIPPVCNYFTKLITHNVVNNMNSILSYKLFEEFYNNLKDSFKCNI